MVKKKSNAMKSADKVDGSGNPHYRSPSTRGGRGMETFNDCSACSVDVTDCDNNILCDFCGHWVHFECADVTPDLYKAMTQSTSSCTYWCCKSCRSPDLPKRLRLLQSLQHRQDKLEQSFANLSQKVDSLPVLVEEKISTVRASLKEEIVSEILEAKRRENNLVISGLRGDLTMPDDALVTQLFMVIKAPGDIQLIGCKRIGKQVNDKPKLLLVNLRDHNQVRSILGVARNLKNLAQYSGVFLSPDRTKTEQDHHKKLRAELFARRNNGENVVIRGDKIVHRSGSAISGPQVVALPPLSSSDSSLCVSAPVFFPAPSAPPSTSLLNDDDDT